MYISNTHTNTPHIVHTHINMQNSTYSTNTEREAAITGAHRRGWTGAGREKGKKLI